MRGPGLQRPMPLNAPLPFHGFEARMHQRKRDLAKAEFQGPIAALCANYTFCLTSIYGSESRPGPIDLAFSPHGAKMKRQHPQWGQLQPGPICGMAQQAAVVGVSLAAFARETKPWYRELDKK